MVCHRRLAGYPGRPTERYELRFGEFGMRHSSHFQSCTGWGLSPKCGRGQVMGKKGVTWGNVLVNEKRRRYASPPEGGEIHGGLLQVEMEPDFSNPFSLD